MEFLNSFRHMLNNLEERTFYTYIAVFFGILTLILSALVYYYYNDASSLTQKINNINELREEKVQMILERAQRVQQQRSDVDEMLAEDEDFKIAGYFESLLGLTNLSNQKKSIETTLPIAREDESYRESILNAKLSGMSMKDLTTLLAELEKTPRIYTKDIEIARSRKDNSTLDVAITIATLQSKKEEESTEFTE